MQVLTNGIVNKPASVTVEDGSGNVKAKTTYCYDEGTPSGTATCAADGFSDGNFGNAPARGRHRFQGKYHHNRLPLANASTTLGQTFTYYDTGNVITSKDTNGAPTTYTYGSTAPCPNSFATSLSEPLSLSRSSVLELHRRRRDVRD